ncbi:MAG TPA: hypothetical protein VHP32_09155 [Ignavibacteria bacterium]|nr:hypothetical protein [Ignavibacteria bacterium]
MNKKITVAKGYRLHPATHNKISKIKKMLNSNTDKAISSACMFYIKHLQTKNSITQKN